MLVTSVVIQPVHRFHKIHYASHQNFSSITNGSKSWRLITTYVSK